MKILYTKRPALGSWLIRQATGEPASHVALFIPKLHEVWHFTGKGLICSGENDFFSKYELAIEPTDLTCLTNKVSYTQLIYMARTLLIHWKYQAPKYGWGYVAWFAWQLVRNWRKPEKLAKINQGATDNRFICTQILYLVSDIYAKLEAVQILDVNYDYGAVTPSRLKYILEERLAHVKACIPLESSYIPNGYLPQKEEHNPSIR